MDVTDPPFDAFEVTGAVVGIPSDADLASTEQDLGVALPRSYVTFVRRFGHGVVDELVHVSVPTRSIADDVVAMASAIESTVRADVASGLAEFAPDGSPAIAARLVRFGSTWNGHLLAWDVGDDEHGEYAIYVVAEGSLAFTKVGYGLERFFASVFDTDVRRVLGPGYRPIRPVFRPLVPTE